MIPNTIRLRGGAVNSTAPLRPLPFPEKLLTTKEVAKLTGMSKSYFDKSRIYGYGPPFIRLRPGSKSGAIRYRLSALTHWYEELERVPGERHHG